MEAYTLSFSEYLEFKKNGKYSEKELLNEYIRMGGFPFLEKEEKRDEVIQSILRYMHFAL